MWESRQLRVPFGDFPFVRGKFTQVSRLIVQTGRAHLADTGTGGEEVGTPSAAKMFNLCH